MGKGGGRGQGGNGHIPTGCSSAEVRSYLHSQDDTDHHLDQDVHRDMVGPAEGRVAGPACSVEVQTTTDVDSEERYKWEAWMSVSSK